MRLQSSHRDVFPQFGVRYPWRCLVTETRSLCPGLARSATMSDSCLQELEPYRVEVADGSGFSMVQLFCLTSRLVFGSPCGSPGQGQGESTPHATAVT